MVGSLKGGNSRVMVKLNPLGRNLRTVWEFSTRGYHGAHFAVFPEKLPEICIKAASKKRDLILDPFAGSGTTLLVARKLGRMAVGYELSREYCQMIVKRIKQQASAVKEEAGDSRYTAKPAMENQIEVWEVWIISLIPFTEPEQEVAT